MRILLGVALLVVGVALAVWIANSTARGNTGLTDGGLRPCPSRPNCVSSQSLDKSHFVAPLSYEASAQEALSRVKAAAAAVSGRLAEERQGYLRFTFTSRLFRFVDDVEFIVDEAAKVIHVRSASRLGYSDLGVNRRRVEAIRARFESRP